MIKAFYEPIQEIFLTLAMFIIVEYYFSLYAYLYLSADYEDGRAGTCNSLLKCFLTTFDWTFKETGSIGAFLKPQEQDIRIQRWIFDNL